jgi:hypothetical protein
LEKKYIYNAKQSHELDLAWEAIGQRREIKFLGIPLYIFRRGRMLETKSNDKRPSILAKTNLCIFLKAIRSTKNIYIGYDRPSVLQVAKNLGVDDSNKLLINENYMGPKSELNYDNSVLLLRYLFALLSSLLMFPFILNYAIRMKLRYFEMVKIIGDILFAYFLILLSNRQKKIYFWGGVPFAVAYIECSNFFEIQHGIIHKYYPALADQKDRKTPMIVWMSGRYDQIEAKDILYLNLEKSNRVQGNLKGVGLCGTTDRDINCHVINIMLNLGVIFDYFKRHPRDISEYNIKEVDFSALLKLDTIYTFPSSIIQELIINNYAGNLCVLNVFGINENDFMRQIIDLYLGPSQNFPFTLSFKEFSCLES